MKKKLGPLREQKAGLTKMRVECATCGEEWMFDEDMSNAIIDPRMHDAVSNIAEEHYPNMSGHFSGSCEGYYMEIRVATSHAPIHDDHTVKYVDMTPREGLISKVLSILPF